MSLSPESRESKIYVWADYDFCTGCGLCVETAPEVFSMAEDGLVRVKQDGQLLPAGQEGRALLPTEHEAAARQAAIECPGQVINFE